MFIRKKPHELISDCTSKGYFIPVNHTTTPTDEF